MATDLRSWIAARAQTPRAVVAINGTPIVNPVSVDVTVGVDQQSATAAIRLAAEDYPSWAVHATVEVSLGYAGVGGGMVTVFVGEVEDADTQFAPYVAELRASGWLKRAQRSAGNTDPLSETDEPVITWANATDSRVWTDLMQLAGVPRYQAGDGDGRVLVGPLHLRPGDSIRGKIDELDQASESGQRTFEWAGQVYRTPALRVPAGVPAWRYTEGSPSPSATPPVWPVYSLQRQQTDRDVKNQAIVRGRQDQGVETHAVVGAVRQEPSPYWGVDGHGEVVYVPFSFQSDFLETRPQCDAVAQRYMYEHNKVTDVVQLRTPLNPYAMPSRTVGIVSDRMGLRTQTNYWVRQVSHHWGAEGASTDWTLEGGAGPTGYLVGLPPIPLFTMKVTREAWQAGAGPERTTFYTVACDASPSYDPDNTPLTYAWSASNGASGTGVTFTTLFTQAQWDATTTPATITLTVTDSDVPDPHDATTGPVRAGDTSQAGAAKVIAMYVAALGVAHATPDAWTTLNAWTPPANCLCCCRIAAQGTNYFGLQSGHVYRTRDYLATAPEDVGWTAPAAVNALWMSELDTNRVAVGLANGDVWLTTDAFATAPVLKRNFGNPVEWITGSAEQKTQWRALVGQDVWYTSHDWEGGDARVLVSFGGAVCRQSELTPFSNYATAADPGAGPLLKREVDQAAIPFPSVTPAPVEAHCSAFIETDELLVGDDQGRAYLGSPASTGGVLVQKTSIGHGAVHDLLRDNTNPLAQYAGCDTALAKTFDRAETWRRVLTYDGTTTRAVRLGYDSAPLTPPVELTDQLIERTSQGTQEDPQPMMHGVDFCQDDYPIENKRTLSLWNPSLAPD